MSPAGGRRGAPVAAALRLFGNAVFGGVILAGAAVLAYAVTRFPQALSNAQVALYYVLPAVAVLGSAWALTRSPGLKTNLALVVVSVGVALLAGEVFLSRLPATDPVVELAAASGREPDTRTALGVAVDLSADGEPAYPHLSASAARQFDLRVEGERVIPLPGAVPGARSVFCNESGIWQTYRADERGFRNPHGAWSAGTPAVALIGDSYTQGFCLPGDEGFAAVLRETWPSALNLGVTASGPLTELAILREYLVDLRPPVVVWFYYEGNDIPDLSQEVGDPILMSYLEPGFRQDLVARQDLIAEALRPRLQALVDGERTGSDPDNPLRGIFGLSAGGGPSVLRLGRMQNLFFGAQVPLPAKGSRLGIFPRIMQEAADAVRGWGGDLYFVYLPTFSRYRAWIGDPGAERSEVLEVIEGLPIKLIDMDPIFRRQDDPKALWSHPAAHYTPAGYRLVGDTVAARILQDGAGHE